MERETMTCLEGKTGAVPASTFHGGASARKPPAGFRRYWICRVTSFGLMVVKASRCGAEAVREAACGGGLLLGTAGTGGGGPVGFGGSAPQEDGGAALGGAALGGAEGGGVLPGALSGMSPATCSSAPPGGNAGVLPEDRTGVPARPGRGVPPGVRAGVLTGVLVGVPPSPCTGAPPSRCGGL